MEQGKLKDTEDERSDKLTEGQLKGDNDTLTYEQKTPSESKIRSGENQKLSLKKSQKAVTLQDILLLKVIVTLIKPEIM